MKTRRQALVALLLIVASATFLPTMAVALPFCDWCDRDMCGCEDIVPSFCNLRGWSCACSETECSRECRYDCPF